MLKWSDTVGVVLIYFLINSLIIICYLIVPELNAPTAFWDGREEECAIQRINKGSIIGIGLLVETFPFFYYQLRKRLGLKQIILLSFGALLIFQLVLWWFLTVKIKDCFFLPEYMQ